MPTPFARLEALATTAVFARLANATARVHGEGADSVDVDGIFENQYDEAAIAVGDIAGSIPTFSLPTADVPAKPVGKLLEVKGKTYKIVEHRPDGTGLSVLRLAA